MRASQTTLASPLPWRSAFFRKAFRNRVLIASSLLVVFGLCPPLLTFAPSLRAEEGSFECRDIASGILRHSVSYCIYLPPSYNHFPERRYPVLYFLHGLYENPQSWAERGGKALLEEVTAAGAVTEFLVVLPNGSKSFYVNSRNGTERYEDFLVQELVPTVDRTYRTLADAEHRGISGTSMGGYGALRLGMIYPKVFGSASAHSAALLVDLPEQVGERDRWRLAALEGAFGSPVDRDYWEQNNPLLLAQHPHAFRGLRLYFDCGDQDRFGFDRGAKELHRILNEVGFPHFFELRPGGHGWSYLNQYMKYSLIFHSRAFTEAR